MSRTVAEGILHTTLGEAKKAVSQMNLTQAQRQQFAEELINRLIHQLEKELCHDRKPRNP